jgi:flagellar biosynthesis chaperone FliJ
MSKPRFNQVTYAILGNLDRRMLGGVFIGVAIMASTMATAGGSSQWFSNLFSTSSGSASTSLISTQSSVIDTAIQADVAKCDEPGGIGFAIQTAMQVHSEIASASPNVESLFDVNNDCFSGIGQIFDLSFAIPGLHSILSAAQDALLAYAKKKICTAVNQVSGMVTTPINGAINKVNTITGFVDINGMANSAVGGAMSTIDPQLGAQYHPTVPSGTYTVGTPFGTSQTTFSSTGTGSTGTGSTGTGSTGTNLQNNLAQINSLTQQIANLQIAVNQDTLDLQSAQSIFQNCMAWNTGTSSTGCYAEDTAMQQAAAQLSTDSANLAAAQTQLSQLTATQSAPQQLTQTVVSGTPASTSSGTSGFWSGLFSN